MKRCREKQKAAQPPKPRQRTLKELAECAEAGLPLTPEEAERLEAHRNRKKEALQDLKARTETDPAAAAELAQQRVRQSEAVKKSRQKMYADAFIKKGFYTMGALKTNRILYPCGIKQKVSGFALHLRKTDSDVSLVTVGSRSYYVYRYEGSLNVIENAVVLISYPKDAFHVPKALRAFISTDVSLSTRKILNIYVERWPVEVFFRQAKDKLAFDRYQVRSSKWIRRYWLLMSLAHLLACTGCGETMSFEDGYAYIYGRIQEKRLRFIYQCGARHVLFEEVLALVA